MISGGVILYLIIIIVFWVAKKFIVGPIIALYSQLDLVAETMDLTHEISVDSQDELGVMAQSVNKVISSFRHGTVSTRESADKLLISAQTMESMANNIQSRILQFKSNQDRFDRCGASACQR